MVAIIEKRDLRDFDWPTALLAIAISGFNTNKLIAQINKKNASESFILFHYFANIVACLCFTIFIIPTVIIIIQNAVIAIQADAFNRKSCGQIKIIKLLKLNTFFRSTIQPQLCTCRNSIPKVFCSANLTLLALSTP